MFMKNLETELQQQNEYFIRNENFCLSTSGLRSKHFCSIFEHLPKIGKIFAPDFEHFIPFQSI